MASDGRLIPRLGWCAESLATEISEDTEARQFLLCALGVLCGKVHLRVHTDDQRLDLATIGTPNFQWLFQSGTLAASDDGSKVAFRPDARTTRCTPSSLIVARPKL
ncbi:hypothetical protein Enr13x_18780 [Stieleria neptunia]|uniref:Uncharacterized protein n=1 Tax=Stieleria neptunia TaxID=2527979 RepID=A0A518HMF5_9BACT|nr:hypothetical protein Enr13x_18780 [Stieleria neptunia]